MTPQLVFRDLGRAAYGPVWAQQRALVERLQAGHSEARETLLAVEHEPVITLGRRGRAEDVLLTAEDRAARGVELFEVERGGEVTYHGPGQLVLYPIVRVGPGRFGVGDLVRGLAAVIADELRHYGVIARYDRERPGLWVGPAKIASVGMRVARGVSMHGAAVNLSTDLAAFDWIVPCGLPDAPMTSLEQQLGQPAPPISDVGRAIAERFAERFEFDLVFD